MSEVSELRHRRLDLMNNKTYNIDDRLQAVPRNMTVARLDKGRR